jgi:hypothetical protein
MAGDSVDVTARTYHTENGVAHAEGETYAVTDRVLAETLCGIGFVTIEGWTAAAPIVATGATAGIPGTWTPAGATAPANLAAMSGITASPTTAWTTGQYMGLADLTHTSWNGAGWVAGEAV